MIHRFTTSTALVIAALALSGCDWFKGVTGSADTEMKNVEILPGTASDEMITLDSASGDGTAIDTSVDVAPPRPGTEDKNGDEPGESADGDDSPDTPVSNEDEPETRPGDVVIRPPSNRSEPPTPTKK